MSETENTNVPEQWAIVSLFGHRNVVGRVSDAQYGGCAFVRVDVLMGDGQERTAYYGQAAIYSIEFVDQATARLIAHRNERLVAPFMLPEPWARVIATMERMERNARHAENPPSATDDKDIVF